MVLKLDNAGDVVLSTLVMARVAENLGRPRVVYVVRRGLGALLDHLDWITDVVEVPYGLGHCSRTGADERSALEASRRILKKAVATFRPGLLIDLRPTPLGNYGALAAFMAGARVRVSLEGTRLGEAFGSGRGRKWSRHEAATFCAALEDAGLLGRASSFRSHLVFWDRAARQRPGGGPYFLLQPGAVWEYKKWPERNYAALIDSLSTACPGHSFILAGSDSERAVCERVKGLTGAQTRERVVNLAGKTTFAELVSLAAGSQMVIANDSGVAHIGGACGVPTVVFFGPSSPERFMPLSERQDRVRVFHHSMPCNPCDQHSCREGPLTCCMARISPDEVFRHIREALVARTGGAPGLREDAFAAV